MKKWTRESADDATGYTNITLGHLILIIVLISVLSSLGTYFIFGRKADNEIAKVENITSPTPAPTYIATTSAELSPSPTAPAPSPTLILPSPTPPRISLPPDWREFTATNYSAGLTTSLSLPTGYSFGFVGSDLSIGNGAGDDWLYLTSIYPGKDGVKNYYDGTARREWYQKYLNGLYSPIKEGDVIAVKQHKTGNSNYLEVTVKDPNGSFAKHYIFNQNGIIHILKPWPGAVMPENSGVAANLPLIFSSLRVSK